MPWVKRLYQFAGIYGFAVLVPQYFLETKTGIDFPPAITHPEFFYGFIGVALSWQFTFLIIARNPVRYRAIMMGAVLEKLSFGVAAVLLFASHLVHLVIAIAGFIDLLFAVAFFFAYKYTAKESK